MKKFTTLFLLALVILSGCGPSIYLAPGFKNLKAVHKKVAVLPFDVVVEARRLPKGVTIDMVKQQQRDNGYSIQGDVYSYFIKEQSKNRYTVEFQDIDKTNALISKLGINYEDLRTYSKEELAQLLGVDAVVSGKVTMSKPMSDGAAIAVGVLIGAWGSTNKVDAAMTIHEKEEGKLLWKYDYAASGSIGSNTKTLTKALMRNVSKNFPYKS